MKALVQAQISAASMGHEKMGSGHLLCGLCRVGDELTRCILGDLTAGEIEEEVLRRCGRGEVGFSRVTGLTPHAQRAAAGGYVCKPGKRYSPASRISGRSFCMRTAARR
ncbi:MAG: hypothetical protein ACLUHE_07570 [Christensenellales bacterium]